MELVAGLGAPQLLAFSHEKCDNSTFLRAPLRGAFEPSAPLRGAFEPFEPPPYDRRRLICNLHRPVYDVHRPTYGPRRPIYDLRRPIYDLQIRGRREKPAISGRVLRRKRDEKLDLQIKEGFVATGF